MGASSTPTRFESSVNAMASQLARAPHRLLALDAWRGIADGEQRLQALHDALLDKDILGDEELMLKCAELRQAMTGEGAARDPESPSLEAPSLEAQVLERAIRELLVAKGLVM
jgi:hypothetical protein